MSITQKIMISKIKKTSIKKQVIVKKYYSYLIRIILNKIINKEDKSKNKFIH